MRKWQTTLCGDPSKLETGAPCARPTEGLDVVAEMIRRPPRRRRKLVQLLQKVMGMSRTSRVNDVQLAKWLEAVLCGDETDMADDTREAGPCRFQGPLWAST